MSPAAARRVSATVRGWGEEVLVRRVVFRVLGPLPHARHGGRSPPVGRTAGDGVGGRGRSSFLRSVGDDREGPGANEWLDGTDLGDGGFW